MRPQLPVHQDFEGPSNRLPKDPVDTEVSSPSAAVPYITMTLTLQHTTKDCSGQAKAAAKPGITADSSSACALAMPSSSRVSTR